jgi:multidrug resistance efflux pump
VNKKIWIALAVLAVIGVGGAAWFWSLRDNHKLRLPGVVEIQEVRLGSKVGGRVLKVMVEEGETIYPGKELVVFEAPELRNQRQQVKARLDAAIAERDRAFNGPRQQEKDSAEAAMNSAKAKWDRAEFGWRVEEKQQAKNELDTAEADYEQSLKEYNRLYPLYRDKSISRSEYEAALGARDRTRGRRDAARAKVEMMKAGTREEDKAEAEQEYRKAKAQFELLREGTRQEDKDLAQAKVDELKANLEAIDINLAETTIVTPPNLGKARVEVIAFRAGDLVQPNQPVLRVLRTEDLWVKVYVPETQLGFITNKKKVEVTIDTYPGVVFQGEIVQRSNIAEFTPRNVQSIDERRNQVFGVKVRVADPKGNFNAGMAAEVTIPLD